MIMMITRGKLMDTGMMITHSYKGNCNKGDKGGGDDSVMMMM